MFQLIRRLAPEKPCANPQVDAIQKQNVLIFSLFLSTQNHLLSLRCFCTSLANLDAPYDITALHTKRQALRDKINSLEIEIATV